MAKEDIEENGEFPAFEDEVDTSQLPSVEEVRGSAAFSSGAAVNGTSKRKRCCCISTLLVGVVVLVVIIGAAVGATRSKESSMPQKAVRDPESAEFIARAEAVTNFVIAEGLSDASAVEASGSAQSQAVGFMAVGDDAQLEIPASKDDPGAFMFVQRYALAVFFYALKGGGWQFPLDFLIGDTTCQWYQTLQNTAGQTFNFGVQCNEDEQVNRILIRESR